MSYERRRAPGDGHALRHGFFAPCSACGEVVVHADSMLEPFHMHARSKKCREAAAVKEKTKERKT